MDLFGIFVLVVFVVAAILRLFGTMEKLWTVSPDSLRAQASQSFQFTEPTVEARGHLQQAIDKWNSADKDGANDILKLDVASELALAIKKANAPFPRAHAYLAMILNDMGKEDEAEKHASIALQQNPNEFRAQLIKIDLALKGVRIVNLRPGHFVHLETESRGDLTDQVAGNVLGTIIGTAGKSLVTLFAAGSAAVTQGKFSGEVERLIHIFRNRITTETSADEYLMMAETLISLGDMIKDVSPLGDIRRGLYAAITRSSVDRISQQGHEKEIENVRHKAEGRLLLLG